MTIASFDDTPRDEERDIVIVGAGIAGLYCAWRLALDDPLRRITIVERLNRVGGRLDTDLIKIADDDVVREEEGGMRFNTSMTELMQLIAALGLCDQIVPFAMSSSPNATENTNRFNLRGRSFTAAEAAAGNHVIWGELYNLADVERGLSPSDLVGQAYTAVLEENHCAQTDTTPPDFWTTLRNTFTWQGTKLRDWQLWGLLRSMAYSQECIQMLSDTVGFAGPFKAPINAGDAFQLLADFPKDPNYLTFRDGFSTLPNAVRDGLPPEVEVMLSTNVDRLERSGDGFTLTLTKAPDHLSSNPYIPGGEGKTRSAGTVILAMATTALEQLFVTSPALNGGPDAHRLWDNITAAQGMDLLKINLYFADAWWRDGEIPQPVRYGPNFTDLPLNSVYPFYSSSNGAPAPGTDPSLAAGAAALTIYCDLDNTAFWSGLQNVGERFSSPLQEAHSVAPQTLFPASKAVVAEARVQLAKLFGLHTTPEPILTSYRFWDGTDDFEHAYHQWRVGVDDSAVRDYLSAPVAGVHICNEAISDMHGWVNGSLRSANLVLQTLGIAALVDEPCPGPATPAQAPATSTPSRSGLWGA